MKPDPVSADASLKSGLQNLTAAIEALNEAVVDLVAAETGITLREWNEVRTSRNSLEKLSAQLTQRLIKDAQPAARL